MLVRHVSEFAELVRRVPDLGVGLVGRCRRKQSACAPAANPTAIVPGTAAQRRDACAAALDSNTYAAAVDSDAFGPSAY
jgi:hypothetical protein